MTPNCESSSDTGSSGLPMRSPRVLPWRESMREFLTNEERKNRAEAAEMSGKIESSIREIVTKEKETGKGSVVALQSAKGVVAVEW